MKIFWLWFFLLIAGAAQANSPITLELQNANLADAIRLVAAELNLNVMISSAISGSATLHLHDADPQQTFDSLLASHGLAKWQTGDVLYIAPCDELIKRQEEILKWREVNNKSETLVSTIWQLRYARAEDLLHVLQDEHAQLLSARGNVRIDKRTNLLYVEETKSRMALIKHLIAVMDVSVPQIAIEVRLASIDHDFERELGVQFSVQTDKSPAPQTETNRLFTQTAGRYSVAIATLADHSFLDVKLAALESAGHAELISSPRLFTANQQPASIEAGEEVPYQEVSLSGGTAIAFKKAVLGLKVTPQVLPGNRVLLQMQINQDRPSNKMVQGVPTISTRQITTNVLVKNGQTIVLGGIYETDKEQGQQSVPVISRVPLLGELFKQRMLHESKRELFIFVTPHIIKQTL